MRHLIGGEVGDVDDEVVVAGVVAGGLREGLRVVLAGLVGVVNQLARLLLVDLVLLHNALHPVFHIGDKEDLDGVGGVLEDVEAGAPDDDAGLLFGQVSQCFGLCVVELLGGDLRVALGEAGSGIELLVETAEL